jgi:hypothetical protein
MASNETHVSFLMCRICNKTFESVFVLKSHTRVHADERPWKCLECPKAYKWAASLNLHQYAHIKKRVETSAQKAVLRSERQVHRTVLLDSGGLFGRATIAVRENGIKLSALVTASGRVAGCQFTAVKRKLDDDAFLGDTRALKKRRLV